DVFTKDLLISSVHIRESDPEKAQLYANQSLALAQKNSNKKGQADAYHNMAAIQYNNGDYDKSLELYNLSLTLRNQIGNKKDIAGSYLNIALVYWDKGNFPEALSNNFKALKLYETMNDKTLTAGCYNNLGMIYDDQGNQAQALKNYLFALKLFEDANDAKGISIATFNIGGIYDSKGAFDKALENYTRSLKLNEEANDKKNMAQCFNNIGETNAKLKLFDKALENFNRALKLNNEINNRNSITYNKLNIARTYIEQKKYSAAFPFLTDALSMAQELDDADNIMECHHAMSILDSAKGNFAQSMEHYKLYIDYRDKLFNETNTKKLVETQMLYEFDKKESFAKAQQEKKDAVALKELQRQKIVRNSFVGGFVFVSLFAGIFFSQRNRIRKEKKRSEDLLLNILPEEVAQELKDKGSADAKQFDEVTVMFTDFKGFTQIAEKLSAKELVAEIDTCFKAFDNIITKYNIEKIKTIGDAYMCAGGLPVANKTHAEDVVKAAIEILQFMEGHLKASPLGRFGGARIGIHTGPVVAGIVGIKKFAYDIWGDTVNIA
ncbi:MAG TPA: adenylate/guanylate cyclase domain-containing protein, partial [Bacteroidia bacterium]|nr:adenylate/guanylate cyclase domain-containing protein [Bacteroidia bacterium]